MREGGATGNAVTLRKKNYDHTSNYYVAIANIKGDEDVCGLAWIDISNGFLIGSSTPAGIGANLPHPAEEIVISQSLYENTKLRSALPVDDKAITLEAASFFDSQMAQARLKSALTLQRWTV